MKLNEKIFENRKKLGLSQEDLANKLDVSRQTVSKWEVGNATPELEKIIKLSEIFDISVDELVKDEVNVNETENANISLKKIHIMFKIIIALVIIILIFIVAKAMYDKYQSAKKIRNVGAFIGGFGDLYAKIGDSKSGKINLLIREEKDGVVDSRKEKYYYYVGNDNTKKLKIQVYEDIDYENTSLNNPNDEVTKEIYIDLNKMNPDTGLYEDVTVINMKDFSKEIIEYGFVNPISYAREAITNRYGKWGDREIFDDFELMGKDPNVESELLIKDNYFGASLRYGDIKNNKENVLVAVMTNNICFVNAVRYQKGTLNNVTMFDMELSFLENVKELVEIPEF